MLTTLGKPAAPGDAVDLLLECHQRIRAFLDLARRLGEARGEPAEAVADAAARVHRYFTVALPLHALDEEESIAPRLRGREPAADAELATMTREHREHQGPLSVLVGACGWLSREPARHGELAAVVRGAAEELTRHFAAHLAREEEVISRGASTLPGRKNAQFDGPRCKEAKEAPLRRGVGSHLGRTTLDWRKR